ncbi:MAG: hypothetical protein LBK68_07955 [Candidatus Margulisbacteria bacterium]|nr:hypothetical protein [Candidatus Margulisiibacteriota bacterium]
MARLIINGGGGGGGGNNYHAPQQNQGGIFRVPTKNRNGRAKNATK